MIMTMIMTMVDFNHRRPQITMVMTMGGVCVYWKFSSQCDVGRYFIALQQLEVFMTMGKSMLM